MNQAVNHDFVAATKLAVAERKVAEFNALSLEHFLAEHEACHTRIQPANIHMLHAAYMQHAGGVVAEGGRAAGTARRG